MKVSPLAAVALTGIVSPAVGASLRQATETSQMSNFCNQYIQQFTVHLDSSLDELKAIESQYEPTALQGLNRFNGQLLQGEGVLQGAGAQIANIASGMGITGPQAGQAAETAQSIANEAADGLAQVHEDSDMVQTEAERLGLLRGGGVNQVRDKVDTGLSCLSSFCQPEDGSLTFFQMMNTVVKVEMTMFQAMTHCLADAKDGDNGLDGTCFEDAVVQGMANMDPYAFNSQAAVREEFDKERMEFMKCFAPTTGEDGGK